ncbi:MAG TPA: phosphotransferase [Anaerolineae bacterium]
MEKQIKEKFTDAMLQEAMSRYDIAADQIQPLGGFESFIYGFERDSKGYILRLGHSSRRSEAMIHGEVDWINYLAAGGTPVARAIPSADGNLVEPIADGSGGSFLATAFEKAAGKPPRDVDWTPELFETYGRLLGKMHALTRGYKLPQAAWQRPQWDDEPMQDFHQYLPASEVIVLEKHNALLDYLNTLPRDSASYGLIHFDAHAGNLFIDQQGQITLFDFDDCAYNWFITDLAIVLFYIVRDKDDEVAFTQAFMPHFLRGYSRENRLDPRWLREIPHFLKQREIDLYAVIHRSFDVNNLDHPWVAGFMHNRKHRIEHDVPYLDFDFESLAVYL